MELSVCVTLSNSIYVEDLNSFKFEVRIKTIFVSDLARERDRQTDIQRDIVT